MKRLTKKLNPFFYFFVHILIMLVAVGLIWLIYVARPFSATKLHFASSYMTMNNDFYPVLNEQVANYVDSKNDILVNRDPALKVDKQVQEIHAFTRQRYNAIILNPIASDSPKIASAVKQAAQKGIKVIVVDNPLRDDRYVTCTIVSANYQAGVMDAKQLMKKRKRAQILLLTQTDVASGRQRIAGFVNTIKNHPNYQIVGRLNTNGQSESTYPRVSAYIKKHPHFNTIMTLNDKVALGALAALRRRQHETGTQVYSVDGSEDVKKMMGTNASLAATVAQSPIQIGKLAVKIAYRVVNGQKVPHRILVPVKIITPQNINQFNVTGWQ